ncbi:hypothetical protein [Psychrilyobacter atlanticus]|uniref:hypothetical protein n=1 Tax=Psychrilyobacter atlanticus TaxID=271091 RepID=UPI000411E0CF|nr:hypothetical protein [Psychrilyobacter atlanticus]
MKKIILIIIIFLGFNNIILADSPITSTNFSEAYEDIFIVQRASEATYLTEELIEYLDNPNNPIDVKVALINELGWDNENQDNYSLFFKYLMMKYHYKDFNELVSKASGDILISLAYLKAMDDYFNVKSSALLAEIAVKKKEYSYTINIIYGLIMGQKFMDEDWSKINLITSSVDKNRHLKRDMREDAIKIIFKYMNIYN